MRRERLHPPANVVTGAARSVLNTGEDEQHHAGPTKARRVYALLGFPVDAVDLEEALALVSRAIKTNTRCFISTPNTNFAMAAQRDPDFRRSLLHSDLVLLDGMPLVWIAKLLGIPVGSRVAGADLFEQLMRRPGQPIRVYFFGGPEGAAARASKAINDLNGAMTCVGYETPGYGAVEELSSSDTISRINESRADFIVVALGAKKGQEWIELNRELLHAPVIAHLGAVVNFTAGTLRRAPTWMQETGLEWAWRISREPTLWRRYWKDAQDLLRVSLFRVVPQKWALLRTPVPAAPKLHVDDRGSSVRFHMCGTWTESALRPLQSAIDAAMRSVQPIEIMAEDNTSFDSRTLGAFLAAYTRVPSVTIIRCHSSLKKSLHRQCLSFLLRP